jgi:hypothetical protein
MATNKSGYRGVTWDKRNKKWRATYNLQGKKIHLGLFTDVHEAGIVVSNFRLEMGVALKVIARRANANRSQAISVHKAQLTSEEKRRIALKGHSNRQGLLKSNRSGYKGVSWDSRRQRWFATVRDENGKRKRLGSYRDKDEAGLIVETYRQTHGLI